MSYTKREWATGNVVGAVDLNRIEDRIANVDVGYSCSGEWVTLTDESVTTDIGKLDNIVYGKFAYLEPITADTIKVTFNGTEYTCNKQERDFAFIYGAILPASPQGTTDWSTYPFAIASFKPNALNSSSNTLYTENAGTYQVKIEAYEKTVETSECFDRARGYSCIESVITYVDETAMF